MSMSALTRRDRRYAGQLPVAMCLLVLSSACGLADVTPAALTPESRLSVDGGIVAGVLTETDPEIMAFRGIPFAAPPVDELRWKLPAPVEPWEGTRHATEFGARCMQGSRVGQADVSENCLYLNIWTEREKSEPQPVMVWVHGGGFTGGAGSNGIYDGTNLASRGVVLVTINYRLNVFGFLAHPALSAESEHGASGNYGLMDIVAALRWVRDNISAFGGDPTRVTVFGESAGAGAVMSLMLIPEAEGLYHRVISESNWVYGWDRALSGNVRGAESGEAQGVRIAEALGVSDPNTSLQEMRAASAQDVLAASATGGSSPFTREGNVWAPNVDDWIIPDDPVAMYRSGRQHDVALIVGMNGNEGGMFTRRMGIEDVGAFEAHIRQVYPAQAAQALTLYDVGADAEVEAGLDHLVHDLYFAGPVQLHARTHARVSSDVWLYHFTHVPPTAMGGRIGSHHAAELGYVFGNLRGDGYTDVDREISDAMMSYWVRFAKDGDPNEEGLAAWPTFDVARGQYLEIGEEIRPGAGLHDQGADLFDAVQAHRRESD